MRFLHSFCELVFDCLLEKALAAYRYLCYVPLRSLLVFGKQEKRVKHLASRMLDALLEVQRGAGWELAQVEKAKQRLS